MVIQLVTSAPICLDLYNYNVKDAKAFAKQLFLRFDVYHLHICYQRQITTLHLAALEAAFMQANESLLILPEVVV